MWTMWLAVAGAQDVDFEGLSLLPEYLDPAPVVGGEQTHGSRFADAAGIVFYGSYVGCTGVLVAPRVVLTAGHCAGGITHVLLDSNDWRSDEGELIEATEVHEYPNSWQTYDIALVVLAEPSHVTPRAMALDCILDDYLVDGARVAVVGYGATRENGSGNTSEKRVGEMGVDDADCDADYIDGMYSGCNRSVSPAGELGAGGDGVDACFGDSGGPLYLLTERGDFLVGITSRAYAGAPAEYPCRDGGIYVRPDAVLDWIEKKGQVDLPRPQCNFAPEPTVEPIVTDRGETGYTLIEANDPDPDNTHRFVVIDPPTHGEVTIRANGYTEFAPHAGWAGEDRFTVRVTDDGSEYEASGPLSTSVEVPVTVRGKKAVIVGIEGSACGTTPGDASTVLGGLALLLLRRRRG